MIAEPSAPRPATLLFTFDSRLASAEMAVAAVALAVALLTALYTIAMRAILVPTGEWVLDLPVELLVVTAVYGSGSLLSRRGHMRVGFLVSHLSGGPAWVVAVASQLAVTAVCAFVSWRAFGAARQAARAGLRQLELFDLPVALLVGTAAFGFLLWTIHAFVGLVAVTGQRPGAPPRTATGHW